MNILSKINFVLVALLGLTAGIPKILRMPQEVDFFQNVGLGEGMVVAFGLVQLLGGLLLLNKKSRFWGAVVTAVAFAVSAIMLLMNGQTAFGIASFVPVLMTGLVMKQSSRKES